GPTRPGHGVHRDRIARDRRRRPEGTMNDTGRDGKRLLRGREAFAIFLGGVMLVFAFFAGGLLIGKWSKPAPPAPQAAPERGPTEYFVVEVGVVDTSADANERVQQLRRQYTSATAELDPTDHRYHVCV